MTLPDYHVGIVAPQHEDLFTFDDLAFKPPKVLPSETEDEYVARCRAKLEASVRASIAVTLTTEGRRYLTSAFHKGQP